jgi:hypothetical protein
VKRRLIYLVAGIVVAALGLLVREPWLGLPWVVAKYVGSALWTGMVYCGFRMLFPERRVRTSALVAAVFSAAIEFSQLLSFPALDAFRATTFGALLLGRTFDWPDLAAYWAGIAVAAVVDRLVQVRFRRI